MDRERFEGCGEKFMVFLTDTSVYALSLDTADAVKTVGVKPLYPTPFILSSF